MWDKIKAASLHLFFSAIIIGAFLLIVYFVWYPYPLYITEGLSQITIILLGVDLVLGPIMTLILFKKGKKYLLFDIAIVITIQLSAFLYGAYTIANGRPVYIVFATDAFKTVSPAMIDISTLNDKNLQYSLFSKPIYVYASAPEDVEKRNELMWSVLSGGKDVEQLPHYYQNYENTLTSVRNKSGSYGYEKQIQQNLELRKQMAALKSLHKINDNRIGLFPFFGNKKDAIALIDLNNGRIIDYLDAMP